MVDFGTVNEWCFDEESWPGPRTGEVSARKTFDDDCSLFTKKGYRKTLNSVTSGTNATSGAATSAGRQIIQTPWGQLDKAALNRPQLGMVELQMSFDYNANILYVTIIQGKNLKSFTGNVAKPDAFILGYLLPQRTMINMRKTCFVMESSSPFWNQTFVYPDLTLGQLKCRFLEISAWSYNHHAPNEFLGEITLDMSGKLKD